MNTRSLTKAATRIALSSASALLAMIAALAARADESVLNDRNNNPFMTETVSAPDRDAASWQSLYSAYGCVYHHSYTLANRWLMSALAQGAGDQILKSRTDSAYLAQGLNGVAAKRHEAAVAKSCCEIQILQALMQSIAGENDNAIDTLKRAALNYPTYPFLKFLKAKINAMEFERSGSSWLVPPDVAQTGGKRNYFSRWKTDKFPLKVYIPADTEAGKVAGYRAGDGQLLRSAFESWQKLNKNKIRFTFEPVKAHADITCSWVSDQKSIPIVDAIGVCSRAADQNSHLIRADVTILTFANRHDVPSNLNNEFRMNALEEVCLHEIGHSLGLNHSSSENAVMCPHAHRQPINELTEHDLDALNSLYASNALDYISEALDAIQIGQYKAALAPLDKAVATNPKDAQTRDAICVCLINAANVAVGKEDYATAITLLSKADSFVSRTESAKIRSEVLKKLHFAYLQSGREKEARKIEDRDVSLQRPRDNAAFLDQYGLKPESVIYYERALAKKPDDLAIREKFCFLLAMLARDELDKNNDDEALVLLNRAKDMLRVGMPKPIINKVYSLMRRAYEDEQRYDEASKVGKDFSALEPRPEVKVDTPKEDIDRLVLAAKARHPEAWSKTQGQKSLQADICAAYERYVELLRQCASTVKTKDEETWATVFIVRHKQYDRPGAQDAVGAMFDLRHRLIDLTDEEAVIDLEGRLPFKKVERMGTSP